MTDACAAVRPFRNVRRDNLARRVITCGILTSCVSSNFRFYQKYHQLGETESGFSELLERTGDQRPVDGSVLAARHVAEDLFHHALLALRRPRQHLAQLTRACKVR